MSVVFHRASGPAGITLPNPALDDTISVQRLGAKGRAAGGKRYYYSKGTTVYRKRWTWDGMPDEAKEALMLFFASTVEGPRYKFTSKTTTANGGGHGLTWTSWNSQSKSTRTLHLGRGEAMQWAAKLTGPLSGRTPCGDARSSWK